MEKDDTMIYVLKSKLHRATVTDANINYEGSISIGTTLMQAADFYEYEKVTVVNINNGERFETYVMRAEDAHTICLNGAAARLVCIGDPVIIMAYTIIDENHMKDYKPFIVCLDSNNKIKKINCIPECD